MLVVGSPEDWRKRGRFPGAGREGWEDEQIHCIIALKTPTKYEWKPNLDMPNIVMM